MDPSARKLIVVALCLTACGCGGSQGRAWRGPRYRASMKIPGGVESNPAYVPPVEPPATAPPPAPPRNMAPPVLPGDLEPMPTPAVKLQEELPPPPAEDEESVQFLIPVPASPMPNALSPVPAKPVLEQSSAERPSNRGSSEVIGEGKIAVRIQGHSTFPDPRVTEPVRLMPIESLDGMTAGQGTMQVQYEPILAPTPF